MDDGNQRRRQLINAVVYYSSIVVLFQKDCNALQSKPSTFSCHRRQFKASLQRNWNFQRKGYATSRHLFFRSSDYRETSNESAERERDARRLRQVALLADLQEATVTIPYSLSWNFQGDNSSADAAANNQLTVRKINVDDLKAVVSLCWNEFQTGPPTTLADFPWTVLSNEAIGDWWDRFIFGPALELSLRMKIQWSEENDDHHVLVLVPLDGEDICGLVELSWQPPEGTRNPPPIPLPMSYKEAYCKGNGLECPEGWVTNLLIAQKYRGRGYSKILMAAVEGLAKVWGCRYIFLHAQPFDGGRIAQALYHGLGYHLVVDQPQNQYSWMDGDPSLGPGMYVVSGVPLLFLRKALMG